MKKNLLVSAALLAASFVPADMSAQDVYSFEDQMFDYAGGSTNLYGVFYHVSANGKYAVGYDDTFVLKSFIWKADKPQEIEDLYPEDERRVSACDVANDGTVVGSWEELADGEEKGYCYPAYMTPDGEWHKLPVPENYYATATLDQDFMCEARAITPDARFIAGNIYVRIYDEASGKNKTRTYACLWENYELKTVYGAEAGVRNTFTVWDISDDGQTIVGMNVAGSGGFNPAFIRNSKVTNLFDCGEPYTGDDDVYVNFNGGIASSIDTEGNIYGYYMENDGETTKYFMYTPAGELVYTDDLVICAGGGHKYGMYDPMYSVLDCSDDGSVVVGGGVVSVGFGMANVPEVAVYDYTDGISRAEKVLNNVGVDWRGQRLIVNGAFNKAEVYSASGALVGTLSQGQVLGTSSLANGTYIVRVTTADGVKSFKIAK